VIYSPRVLVVWALALACRVAPDEGIAVGGAFRCGCAAADNDDTIPLSEPVQTPSGKMQDSVVIPKGTTGVIPIKYFTQDPDLLAAGGIDNISLNYIYSKEGRKTRNEATTVTVGAAVVPPLSALQHEPTCFFDDTLIDRLRPAVGLNGILRGYDHVNLVVQEGRKMYTFARSILASAPRMIHFIPLEVNPLR
jgi:hypothetical protein